MQFKQKVHSCWDSPKKLILTRPITVRSIPYFMVTLHPNYTTKLCQHILTLALGSVQAPVHTTTKWWREVSIQQWLAVAHPVGCKTLARRGLCGDKWAHRNCFMPVSSCWMVESTQSPWVPTHRTPDLPSGLLLVLRQLAMSCELHATPYSLAPWY